MELELKHFKGYLDCGLLGIASFLHDTIFAIDSINAKKLRVYGETKFGNNVPIGCFLKEFKPLLYPLSSLTKEIEHDGERFVPIYKMFSGCYFPPKKRKVYYQVGKLSVRMFEKDSNRLLKVIYGGEASGRNTHRDMEKLFEWHFDVFGLIDQGQAIDKTTVNLKV